MFSSQKRRSASFLGRREFNGSGSAVTGKKFKRTNSPAAQGTRREFIEGGVRVLTPKFPSAGDTNRLQRCTVARFRLMNFQRGRILPSVRLDPNPVEKRA